MNTKDIEDFIKLRLHENLKLMQAETGQRVNQSVVVAAERQALAYWHTMRMIAERITDTEVKLSLPECRTPKGRTFTIEGVVDIVQEDACMSIYDIKTMPRDYVENNKSKFAMQLNVYAHILGGLKGYKVKRAAVIATAPADGLKRRFNKVDLPVDEFISMLKSMDPFVDIPLNEDSITDTITKFGEIVDRIQDGDFKPKSLVDLKRKDTDGGKHRQFGTDVCRNCDARFSCSSYRSFRSIPENTKKVKRKDTSIWEFFTDCGDSLDVSDDLDANTSIGPEDLVPPKRKWTRRS
jgi:hypothetical protein